MKTPSLLVLTLFTLLLSSTLTLKSTLLTNGHDSLSDFEDAIENWGDLILQDAVSQAVNDWMDEYDPEGDGIDKATLKALLE